MSLDVVVVTFNSGAHLRDALRGLPPEARVVVVDNASTDDSVEIARELGAEVVESPVNAGFGAAANTGARRGDAEHVLLLNPDAVVTPDLVRALVARLTDAPGLAVVSPRLRHHDGREQRVRWPFPSAAGAWREALGLHRMLRSADRRADGFVIGACFLVRREAFESVGGFDERIWLYGEESELCRRILDAGWGIAVADELEARHVGGASGAGVEDLVFEHFERGGEHNVAIHDGRRALVSYRLANLTGALARSWLPGRGDLHRRRARRLAALLSRRPADVALDSPATGARGEGLVVCSLEAWDEIWRRNQFLVRELLARDPNRRVLFVEPPFDRVHELRRRSGRRHVRGLRPLDGDGRIVRVEPVKWWPRALGGAADRSLRRQVRHAARELGLREPTLWVNDPHYAGLATETGWSSLYDITDDWTEAGDGGRATEGVRRAEARLFDECGAVVVCSEGLATTRRSARPDLVVIPNAVDVHHVTRPRLRPADLPVGPVAVYVGTLHEDRLDVALVERLAREVPDLTVVLVGPSSLSAQSTRRLGALVNVVLAGPRPYSDVPGYLQHADVVIVPHVVSAFTESLDPIKAYECLAVGRPTVATPVAGFRDLVGPVTCVGADEFAEAVGRVVAGGWAASEPMPMPSWSDRASAFASALAVDADPRSGHLSAPVRLLTPAPPTIRPGRASPGGLQVNGRFMTRPTTGVERVAHEVVNRLERPVDLRTPPEVLASGVPGHVWEQTILPRHADGLLWSPCNTGPVNHPLQVVTIHDTAPLQHPEWFTRRFGLMYRWLTPALCRNAAAIVTVSSPMADELVRLGARPSRLHVIENGISSWCRPAGDLEVAGVRSELGLGEAPYVVAVASLDPRKNLARLLEAWGRLTPTDTKLVLVGGGATRVFRSVEVTASDSVIAVGRVPDEVLGPLISGAEALVSPSLYEGFGLPAVEALACGTSVVVSDIAAHRALLTEFDPVFVDPYDVSAIAQGIRRALRHGHRPDPEAVRSRYSWERAAADYSELFGTLLSRSPRPAMRS